MYTIVRADQKAIIFDANDKPVYTSPLDGYIIYRHRTAGAENIVVSKIGNLTDEELLLAVVNAVKIA